MPDCASRCRTASQRGNAYRVERPGGGELVGRLRRTNDALKRLLIARREAAARSQHLVEDLQLGEKHRRLQRIEASGHAESHRDIPGALGAATANLAHGVGQSVIVRKDRPAITESPKRLGWIKAGGRNLRECAHSPRANHSAEALRGVGDNRESIPEGHRFDSRVVCWAAIKINWDMAIGRNSPRARVNSITRSRCSAAMLQVAGSISVKTGTAPAATTAPAVAENVNAGTKYRIASTHT
jgi:hypothetical protein